MSLQCILTPHFRDEEKMIIGIDSINLELLRDEYIAKLLHEQSIYQQLVYHNMEEVISTKFIKL